MRLYQSEWQYSGNYDTDTCFAFRYFCHMLFIFSSNPFYTNQVHLPVVGDPPPRSLKIQNFGCISRMQLEHWMAATSIMHHQSMNILPTKTVKVSYHKTVFLVAPLILGLFLHIPDGRVKQQMHAYMRALFQMAWSFLKVNTIWQMQDSHLVRSSWFHTEVHGTIWQNGVVPKSGMFLHLLLDLSFIAVTGQVIKKSYLTFAICQLKMLLNTYLESWNNISEYSSLLLNIILKFKHKFQLCCALFTISYIHMINLIKMKI